MSPGMSRRRTVRVETARPRPRVAGRRNAARGNGRHQPAPPIGALRREFAADVRHGVELVSYDAPALGAVQGNLWQEPSKCAEHLDDHAQYADVERCCDGQYARHGGYVLTMTVVVIHEIHNRDKRDAARRKDVE